jgi:hypothetical protein
MSDMLLNFDFGIEKKVAIEVTSVEAKVVKPEFEFVELDGMYLVIDS